MPLDVSRGRYRLSVVGWWWSWLSLLSLHLMSDLPLGSLVFVVPDWGSGLVMGTMLLEMQVSGAGLRLWLMCLSKAL